MVLKLHKAIYGLKQAPRQWNKTIGSFMPVDGSQPIPLSHQLYLHQLTVGCGVTGCTTEDCGTRTTEIPLAPKVGAARAIELTKSGLDKLCMNIAAQQLVPSVVIPGP